mgnify:CR=1 FL=1|jgi:hypothetical protein
MKRFKIFSSETILYETEIEARTEADAWLKFELNEGHDEVDRLGFQTDDIKEIVQ